MAIAITPLINHLEDQEVRQVWYADAATAGPLTSPVLVGEDLYDWSKFWVLYKYLQNVPAG